MQIIAVGDFFQLPPIVKNTPEVQESQMSLMQESDGRFACDSLAWNRAKLVTCYLTEQHRQDDQEFLSILSAIRRDNFLDHHWEKIQARKIDYEMAPATAPKLFSYNLDVDRVNHEILEKIPSQENYYTMSCEGPEPLVLALKKGCLSPESLNLKIGAAVMFTKNNPKEGFVNGTLGVVEGFDKHTREPIVKTRDGRTVKVETMDWVIEEDGKPRAKVSQLPLRLAWAITVHKSQGMTLDAALIDLRKAFVEGMGYVALSRVRSLETLYLAGINRMALQISEEAHGIDAMLREKSHDDAKTHAHLAANAKTREVNSPKKKNGASGWAEKLAKMRKEHPNAYMPWTNEQDALLKQEFQNGVDLHTLSKLLGRHEGSIKMRLQKHFGEDIA
jgi:ATP-dependent exoDNAse (exonuclease V) alpha subunit